MAHQLRMEAAHFLKLRSSISRNMGESDNYRVKTYASEAYRPKSYLKKMMAASQYDELCSILMDLWKLNQQHVDEPVIEVNIYFSLTGANQSLADRLLAWTRSFLAHRVPRYNPRDHNSESRKFCRLLKEYLDIFEDHEHTIDYLCTSNAMRFAECLAFEHTLKKVVRFRDAEEPVEEAVMCGFPDFLDQDDRQLVSRLVGDYGLGRDEFGVMVRMALADGLPSRLRKIAQIPDAILHNRIRQRAEDIVAMRPYLVRNFRPENTVLPISSRLVLASDWSAHAGIMNLHIASTQRDLLARLPQRGSVLKISLALDGSLLNSLQPWIRLGDAAPYAEVSNVAINAYLVELIHERLFSFYDQIDQTRLRRWEAAESVAEEDEDEALAWSCRELATCQPEETTPETERVETQPDAEDLGRVGRLIRPLRPSRFLHILKSKLGCDVRTGKGDETTVYRPGGKIYCMGRPPEIRPEHVKRALRHLNISTIEWLRAVGD